MASVEAATFTALQGGCDCRQIRYELLARPLFTNCCHCRWCQRESGAAFALNAIIEAFNVRLLSSTAPDIIDTPSASGDGQQYARCPTCQIAVWSNFSDPVFHYVRVGSLDNPDAVPPNVHIYTSTKQPWVVLDDTLPIYQESYKHKELWPKESVERATLAREKFQKSN